MKSLSRQLNFLIYLSLGFFLLLIFNFVLRSQQNLAKSKNPSEEVPSNSQNVLPIKAAQNKKVYKIAVFGDSMVETMGENLDFLNRFLKRRYPSLKFQLYNYGVGGNNVEMGLGRFDNSFQRGNRNYPSLAEVHPDVLIVGSFSYNPFIPHDKEKHKRLLTELAHRGRSVATRVYILKEIAPLETGFGKGPGGVNWPEDIAKRQVGYILDQLDNVSQVASNLNVGFIDVYSVSLTSSGRYGSPRYVNSHDGIHPSESGQVLTANRIVSKISLP